jgi:hypothetical protein
MNVSFLLTPWNVSLLCEVPVNIDFCSLCACSDLEGKGRLVACITTGASQSNLPIDNLKRK